MPLSIKKPQPIDIPNMASKLPEPFRKPAAMLGSLASEFMPAQEDVIGQVMPTPLVSMYRDVGVRKMFTDEALEEAKALYPEHVWPKIEELFSRYPRTAAHMELQGSPNLREVKGAEGLTHWSEMGPNWQENTGGHRMPVVLDENTAGTAGSPDLLMHELTHVAQRLGNKDTPQAYAMAMKGLEEHPSITQVPGSPNAKQAAYINNPFERSARVTALRTAREMDIPAKPAVKGLQQFADAAPNNKYLQDSLDLMLRKR